MISRSLSQVFQSGVGQYVRIVPRLIYFSFEKNSSSSLRPASKAFTGKNNLLVIFLKVQMAMEPD